MSGIPTVTPTSLPNPGTTGNPTYSFAYLQSLLATSYRKTSNEQMDELSKIQAFQKEASLKIAEFEKKKADAGSGSAQMTADQVKWCVDNGISLPRGVTTGPASFNSGEWGTIVKNTQSAIDAKGAFTQQLMVLIQESVGQYNAYTQGASSSINGLNEAIKYMARF